MTPERAYVESLNDDGSVRGARQANPARRRRAQAPPMYHIIEVHVDGDAHALNEHQRRIARQNVAQGAAVHLVSGGFHVRITPQPGDTPDWITQRVAEAESELFRGRDVLRRRVEAADTPGPVPDQWLPEQMANCHRAEPLQFNRIRSTRDDVADAGSHALGGSVHVNFGERPFVMPTSADEAMRTVLTGPPDEALDIRALEATREAVRRNEVRVPRPSTLGPLTEEQRRVWGGDLTRAANTPSLLGRPDVAIVDDHTRELSRAEFNAAWERVVANASR